MWGGSRVGRALMPAVMDRLANEPAASVNVRMATVTLGVFAHAFGEERSEGPVLAPRVVPRAFPALIQVSIDRRIRRILVAVALRNGMG